MISIFDADSQQPMFYCETADEQAKLETFFNSYPKNSKIIVMRKESVTLKNSGETAVICKNAYVSNNGKAVKYLKEHPKMFGKNTYISIAPRYIPSGSIQRKLETVRCIDRIVADIDPIDHDKPFTDDEIKEICEAMEDFLPIIPAFIVYSGSGIQLHFLFDEEYKIYHNQYVYKYLVKQMNMEIYEYLTKKGIKIGKIDTLTCNSVCRMPYTWNNRAKDYSRILVINEDRIEQKRRPSFDMMLFLFKIKPPKEYIKGEKKQRLTSKQVYSNSTITRFEKFYKINIDCFKPGYRNKALYALAYSIAAICHCKDMLKHIIYNINYMLPKPLEMAEVEVIIRSAISHSEKGHPYGLISQIRWIGLNPFSMKSTELLFSSTPEERKESHAIASHKYSIKQLRKRWKAKSKLIIEVAECFKKKQNKTEVAETMHLSRKTVIKYVRIMTEITEAKAKNSINSIYYFFQKYGISKVKSLSPEKQIGVPYSKCVKSADTITGTDKIVDLKGTYSTTNLSNRVLLC